MPARPDAGSGRLALGVMEKHHLLPRCRPVEERRGAFPAGRRAIAVGNPLWEQAFVGDMMLDPVREFSLQVLDLLINDDPLLLADLLDTQDGDIRAIEADEPAECRRGIDVGGSRTWAKAQDDSQDQQSIGAQHWWGSFA